MRRDKLKRFAAGSLATFLCVSMNINPIGVIAKEIAESSFVNTLGIVGDNIVYSLRNMDTSSISTVKAEDDPDKVIVVNEHSGDIIDAIDRLDKNNTAHVDNAAATTAFHIDAGTTNIVTALDIVNKSIVTQTDKINTTIVTKANEIMANDDKNTDRIITAIEQAQHQYKVAYLYSINNMNDQVLWRPTLDELPNAEAIPMATTGYAAVYSGFWDAGVDNKLNANKSQDTFGIQDIQHASDDTQRALEILGYDAIVRAEGYHGTVNANNGTYVSTLMKDGDITWGDAVQVLYKALGQEIYSYSYFTTANNITPETSPLSQSLSNITTFDTSEGAYYLFVSRSDRLTGDSLTTLDPVYWTKAQNDGLVAKDNYSKNINWKDFIQLAARMMELYGEPVLTETERNALLQVYGAEYPVQLGQELADAWSYLKARGVLSYNNISYSSAIHRDELLDVCMRIKDENSRLDYKNIQLVLDLDDAMVADGYYPVPNAKYSVDTFQSESVMDYEGVDYYDYFVLASSTQLGTITDATGTHNISPNFVTESGKAQKSLHITDASMGVNSKLDGAVYSGMFTDSDNNTYYHFQIPKEYTGTIRIESNNDSDYPKYIDIDVANSGGGIYTSFAIDSYSSGKDGDTSVNSAGLMVTSAGRKLFGGMQNSKQWLRYVDYKRAGGKDPSTLAAVPNASIREYLAYEWTKWTTPMEVKAADITYKGSEYIITVNKDQDTSKYANEITLSANSISRLLNTTATVMKSKTWMDYINSDKCTKAEDFKKALEACKNYYQHYDSGAGGVLAQYAWVKDLYEDDEIKVSDTGDLSKAAGNTSHIGGTLYHMVTGEATKYNGVFVFSNQSGSISDEANFPVATNNDSFASYIGDLNERKTTGNFYKMFDYLINQYEYIYNLIKSCDIDDITLHTTYSMRESNKISINKYRYHIQTPKSDTIKDILGEVASLTPDGDEALQQQTSTTASSDELSYSVSNSMVMNSMDNENILISWDDLLSCGIVTDTFKGEQPTPTFGIYYLQTKQGIIKVNPMNYKILVGTTLYNLRNQDGTGPRLVYIDENSKVYFDYRCIMGIACNGIQAEGTKVTDSDNSIGTGTSAVYTLSGSGVTSPVMSTTDITSYNWPNLSLGSNEANPGSFTTTGITATNKDELSFKSLDGEEITYWSSNDKYAYDDMRIALSTFGPTANWVTVIKMDKTTGKHEAGLFVWYARKAFESISQTGTGLKTYDDATLKSEFSGAFGGNIYPECADLLQEFDKDGTEYSKTDCSKWWNAMTYDAYVNLFRLVGDSDIFYSPNYVCRYFNISDCSAIQSLGTKKDSSGNDVYLNGNDKNAVYWLENIGFVYNTPNLSDFDIVKYLNGEIPLPIAYDGGHSIGDNNFMYINPDYYTSIKDTISGGSYDGYGYAAGTKGIYDVTKIANGSYGLIVDLSSKGEGSQECILDSDPIQYAPSGCYAYFNGTEVSRQTADDMNDFVLTNNLVFMGNQRLYPAPSSGTSQKNYYRGCKYMKPITFDNCNPEFWIVYSSLAGQVLINPGNDFSIVEGQDDKQVDISALQQTDIENLIDKLNLHYLLNRLDDLVSWIILFVFYVCPIIGAILVTILVGLSFITSNRLVQMICEKTFDPIRLLTFGNRNVHTLTWKNSLFPCIICYIALALILNGNIIKITAWVINFVQAIKAAVL